MGKIEDELSTYIHLSKYARWIEKENRRETWDETVDRLINYWFNKYPSLGVEVFMELREAIYKREVMPSMRSLMTAGPALDRDNAAAFNCAAIAVNHPRVFDEIFYLLMNGCGVGFSVERKYINKLPTVSEEFHHTDSVIKVKDSKIGWAKALKELIALLYNGDIPTWDLSEVRPAGARLKVFGGRASGPLPLDRLLKYTCRVFKGAVGRQLTTIECHDLICKIAETVIVGSVRRSACISLSNLSDDRMRRAKTGAWWETNPERALANISVAYTEKPDMESFTKEFRNLYQSKAGERGIINKNALRRKAEECGREYEGEYLLNPCFHGDTVIETVDGPQKIKDITEPTYVYTMDHNGDVGIRRASASWVTKENAEVLSIVLNTGKTLRVTPDHKVYKLGPTKGCNKDNHQWVEAKDLRIGDKLNGLYRVRRGTKYSGIKLASGGDYVMEHRLVYEGVFGPIRPDFDVHHIDENTYNNTISNLESMSHSSHSTLTRITNPSDHQVHCGVTGNFVATGVTPKTIIPVPEELKTNTGNSGVRIVKITRMRELHTVYDITVEDTHNVIADGVVAHNCGEAILRDSGGFCCLSEVVIRPYDTLEDLKKKVRYATILGTLQVSLSNFRYLRKVWTTNQEEERLIGVSFTGIMDHEVMCGSIMEFVEEVDADSRTIISYPHREAVISWLKELKQVAKETNEEWAARLGINPSKQLSLIKPSGTVSQLCNTSSGIHPRYSKYYIRRVRQDIKDPLTDLMIDEGIPYVVQGEKAIFSFPVKSPEGSITNSDLDALDQLNLWKIYRDHWCEGNPSQTIYYNDNTFLKVQDWVWDNWSSIGGLSFFPADDNIYENAPYESISEEKYEELISSFPTVLNWSRLNEFEKEDNTGMETEFACSGGNCELV